MGLKKRVSAFLLAVSLSFGLCATDYLEVQALEWAGVTIGLDTALKFLLGLVGVSVGVGVADSIDWTETREQCITFQQNQGNSAVAVSNWWADVIRGKLDTASDCWTSFKEWVKTQLSFSSGGGSLSFDTASGAISTILPDVVSRLNMPDRNVTYAFYYIDTSGIYHFYLLNNTAKFLNLTDSVIQFSTTVGINSTYSINYNPTNDFLTQSYNNSGTYNLVSNVSYYFYNISYENISSRFFDWFHDVVVPSDGVFEGAYDNVTDISLGSSIASDLPQEGILDIPWENVGDTAESVDGAIDTAIDNVQSGTWTLDQYWEYVQNITNVYAYDITNNYLLPNDGSNETTEDKVQENVSRGAFVLAGLEKVFPFCIPWDIYAFVTLLVADPVAPVIEYPIYNPVTDSEEIITIDFSVWQDQVVIMRYIFDFLLIIGLLLLARSLIGAGGSD